MIELFSGVNFNLFHQRFLCAVFVQKFVHSQNVSRKKALVRNTRMFNVDEMKLTPGQDQKIEIKAKMSIFRNLKYKF